MKKIICVLILLSGILLLNSFAYAQERVIKLRDGAVLRGEILSKENNIYKISSKTLGIVSVKDADIVSIEEDTSKAQDWDAYQQKIINNPRLMESIVSLSKDPQVIEILSDPRMKEAIERQDAEYLRNNEKFLKFTNLPTVKKIIDEVTTSPQKEGQKFAQ